MTLKVIVKPLAAERIAEAFDWYENKRNGLGLEFLKEWESTSAYIKNNPEYFQKKYKNFRQAIFHGGILSRG